MSVLGPWEALGLGSFSRAPVRPSRREPLQSLVLPSLPPVTVLQRACLFGRMQTPSVELGQSVSIESPAVACIALLGLGEPVLTMGTGVCSHQPCAHLRGPAKRCWYTGCTRSAPKSSSVSAEARTSHVPLGSVPCGCAVHAQATVSVNTPCASPVLESRPGAQRSPTVSLRVRLEPAAWPSLWAVRVQQQPRGHGHRGGSCPSQLGPWSARLLCLPLVRSHRAVAIVLRCCPRSHEGQGGLGSAPVAGTEWSLGPQSPPPHVPMTRGGVRPLAHAGFLACADNRGRVQSPVQCPQGRVCSGRPGLCRPAHPVALSVDQAPQRAAETTAPATVR